MKPSFTKSSSSNAGKKLRLRTSALSFFSSISTTSSQSKRDSAFASIHALSHTSARRRQPIATHSAVFTPTLSQRMRPRSGALSSGLSASM